MSTGGRPVSEFERLTALPSDMARLASIARSEGFLALDALVEEWNDGVNRFDGPGEMLLGLRDPSGTIAIGGLNRDPFAPEAENAGRIRHVFVVSEERNRGIGARMMEVLEDRARRHGFSILTLFTPSPDAARFYERLGFEIVEGTDHRSHQKPLVPGTEY